MCSIRPRGYRKRNHLFLPSHAVWFEKCDMRMRHGELAVISSKISMDDNIICHHSLSLLHPTLSSYKDIHCEDEKKGKERHGDWHERLTLKMDENLLFYDEPLVFMPSSSPSFCLLYLYCCCYMTRWRFKSGNGEEGGRDIVQIDQKFSFLFLLRALWIVFAQRKKKGEKKRTTILNSKRRRHGLCSFLLLVLYFYKFHVESLLACLHCFAYVAHDENGFPLQCYRRRRRCWLFLFLFLFFFFWRCVSTYVPFVVVAIISPCRYAYWVLIDAKANQRMEDGQRDYLSV